MKKSDLICDLSNIHDNLSVKMVEQAVKTILEYMSKVLEDGERIEIREFGVFSLHYRAEKLGRNPKTGEKITIHSSHVPFFKVSKKLKKRINNNCDSI